MLQLKYYSIVRKLWNPVTEEFYGDDLVVYSCFTKRGAWRVADRYKAGKFRRHVDAKYLPHPNAVWTVRPQQDGDFEKFQDFVSSPKSTIADADPGLDGAPAWGFADGQPRTVPVPPKRPASVAPEQLAVDGLWGPKTQGQWYYSRTSVPLPEKIFPEDTAQGMKEREKMIREREEFIREVQRQMNKRP